MLGFPYVLKSWRMVYLFGLVRVGIVNAWTRMEEDLCPQAKLSDKPEPAARYQSVREFGKKLVDQWAARLVPNENTK